MTDQIIGFAGAGIMGAPMIANLVEAGYEVRGLGRSANSRGRITAARATLVDSPRDLVEGADVVITMLPDSPDVLGLVLGEGSATGGGDGDGADAGSGGLIDHLRPGQLFIDMSTIRPDDARVLHERLAASGVAALDAPVSGGEAAAVTGSLSIMVGGEAEALERARTVLEVLGATITHVGPAGAGQATKAANQLIVASNIQAVAEAIVLLEASGVELEPALDAISGGLAGSTVLTRKRGAFLSGDFAPGFRIALHDKDLGIVQSTARTNGLSLPATAVVSQLVAALKARGDGDLDHSALLKLTRELNGRNGAAR